MPLVPATWEAKAVKFSESGTEANLGSTERSSLKKNNFNNYNNNLETLGHHAYTKRNVPLMQNTNRMVVVGGNPQTSAIIKQQCDQIDIVYFLLGSLKRSHPASSLSSSCQKCTAMLWR